MFRFIWNNWVRHKERFILLLIGTLIIGSGLSYLVGMAQTNKGTIIDTLEKRWSASYDIVVRPQGSRSVSETKHLLEPNYLSGLSGGISLEQYHKIQKIPGVKVAAPIAMVGYIRYDVPLKKINLKNEGVYRVRLQESVDIGPKTVKDDGAFYFVNGPWSINDKGPEYGVGSFNNMLSAGSLVLLAGIDPKAEAELVGLKGAVDSVGSSRYFTNNDLPISTTDQFKLKNTTIPILISNRESVDEKYTYTIERLDLPFQNANIANKTMEKVKANGGDKYLDSIGATSKQTYTFTAKQAHDQLIEQITGINSKTGKPAKSIRSDDSGPSFQWLVFKTSPLKLSPVTSPFQQRWPFAYDIKLSQEEPQLPTIPSVTYRAVKLFGKTSIEWPRIYTNWIGTFDPGKLNIAQDPLTELPMETYSPASANLVLNAKGQPVNPPIRIKPSDTSYGLLTKPPGMLTTIDAAAKILGDKPISAIRIKVAGVTKLNKKSEQKLKQISQQIQNETGLITDITLGSSPQPALTHVPATEDQSALGWIEQPWVKIGSSYALFNETKVGFSGIIGSVVLVAIIYVFTSLLISLLARRKEFAVLLAMGWQPSKISKMILLEGVLLGGFVAIVAWAILGVVLSIYQTETTVLRLLLTGLFGLLIYGIGAIIPAIIARKIHPMEAMRSGEISHFSRRWLPTRSVLSMALTHLLSMWRRSLLSIVAISVPTSLLAVFLLITFRLQGVMYSTWLGQYVALRIGPQHYVAMAVALLIAILTTAEVMWQNISERQPEIALFKAIGWRNRSVRLLVLLEGGLCGLFAAIIGLFIAFIIIWFMYHNIPVKNIGFILSTGIVPILTGFVGAVLPAERAVRIHPSQGVLGQYANMKNVERRFRIGLGITAAALLIGFFIMLMTTIPTVKTHHQASIHHKDGETGTKGMLKPGLNNNSKSDKKNKDKKVKSQWNVKLGDIINYGNGTLKVTRILNTLPPEIKDHIQKYEKPLPDNKKYVTVEVKFNNDNNIPLYFEPFYSEMMSDSQIDKPVYTSVTQGDKSWTGGQVDPGDSVTVAVTYAVPKEAKKMKVIFKNVFFSGLGKNASIHLK